MVITELFKLHSPIDSIGVKCGEFFKGIQVLIGRLIYVIRVDESATIIQQCPDCRPHMFQIAKRISPYFIYYGGCTMAGYNSGCPQCFKRLPCVDPGCGIGIFKHW